VSALSSRTWRGLPSASSPSTSSATQRSNGSNRARGGAIKWTRLSYRTFAANAAVRLQLHALAYKLDNFMWTLAVPKAAEPWSLTSLNEKLVKIGAKVVSHGRYVTFQMPRSRCRDRCSPESCRWSPGYGHRPGQHERREGPMRSMTMGKVRLDAGKALRFRASAQSAGRFGRLLHLRSAICRCPRRRC
jgi:Transposase DDE domain group 1